MPTPSVSVVALASGARVLAAAVAAPAVAEADPAACFWKAEIARTPVQILQLAEFSHVLPRCEVYVNLLERVRAHIPNTK